MINKAWKWVHIMHRYKITLVKKNLYYCSLAGKDMFDRIQNKCARIVLAALELENVYR
jgi:hypothetical protein